MNSQRAVALAVNAGSSSLKFGVYRADGGAAPQTLVEGTLRAQDGGSFIDYRAGTAASPRQHSVDGPPRHALEAVFRLPETRALGAPDVVGHRIVHGGPSLRRHAVIDAGVRRGIEAAADIAPLHVPPALDHLDQARQAFPRALQVACFDTAFHHPLPDLARVLPLPEELRRRGIERYGFHGLSCESILDQLGTAVPPRLIVAHLGSGASVTAIRHGRSIDTSMGFTPSGGLPMATRSGDLDPGILLYLLRDGHAGADVLEAWLEHRAGLQGISGIDGDMRVLQRSDDPRATLAIAQFARAVARQAAGMIVALGGLDLLVFTGGIGEHAADFCADVWRQLAPCRGEADYRRLNARENERIAHHALRLWREAA